MPYSNFDETLCETGCGQPRKPRPANPKFKQSKYCTSCAVVAKAAFYDKIGFDREAAAAKRKSYADAMDAAHVAGMAAGRAVAVAAMQVVDNGRVIEVVSGGVCGFAWVQVRPATSSFARWAMKKYSLKASSYESGLCVKNVHEFGQSLTRSEAYAQAYAQVLRERLNIDAVGRSRID